MTALSELSENQIATYWTRKLPDIYSGELTPTRDLAPVVKYICNKSKYTGIINDASLAEYDAFWNDKGITLDGTRDLLVKGNVKSLGTVVRDPHLAEQWGFLDNHFDESELTYIGTPECGIWYLKGHEKPEPTLAELKAQKLAEISAEAHKYSQYECAEMYLTSSRGFRINTDGRAQDNLKGLIGIGLTCKFKDYDNEFHDGITVEDLNLMLLECYQNGASLYQQKFAYEARVNAAKSAEDLNFEVTFLMADFSAK